jgi:outer membrane protein
MKRLLNLTTITALLFTFSLTTLASENMMVRMRAINVMPDESGTPTVIGGEVKLNNDSVPEIDFTYFINKNFAIELILATTTHKASAFNTSLNNLDLGDVSLLPPTLTAQYHHDFGNFKPYVGVGLNYTFFYGADYGVAKNVEYDNSLGYALQIGTDYKIGENLYLNVDIKKIYLSTDVKVDTYSNGSVTADVEINPYIVGLGLGFKF